MIKTIIAASLICLATSACSESITFETDSDDAQADSGNASGPNKRIGANPNERAVRIGEGGPRFDACQAIGKVAGLNNGDLKVLIAPFDSAKEKDSLVKDTRVYICSRSHDQQWFGVVYAEAALVEAAGEGNALAAPPPMVLGDCGVSSPVRSKRAYAGPCKSGWVESNFIKLIAG